MLYWPPITRLIPILTGLIGDLKKDRVFATINNFELYDEQSRNMICLRRTLSRGSPDDPVSADEIVNPCRQVARTLKAIKGLGADTEKTNVMTRIALLTAAICFEALAESEPEPGLSKLTEQDLDEPLIHIFLSYVLERREFTPLFKRFLEGHGFLEVDCFNSKGVTPLYVAIKKNNLEMAISLIDQGANWLEVSLGNDSALHAAVGHPTILKYLLEVFCHPELDSYNNQGFTPMHLAVISKQLEQVELIAEANDEVLGEFVKHNKKTCLHLAVDDESVEIVEAIFKRLEQRFGHRAYSKYIITSQADDNGHTPFHAALQGKNKDIIELFLRNGAFLSEKGKNEKTALEIIVTHFNDGLNILCNAFDDSFSISTTSGENTIDYSSFTDIKDISQINVIEKIVQCDQSDLLLHPLIQSYVYVKWNYFVPLFYTMISVHAIFLITFNVLVANIFYHRDTSNGTLLTNQTSNDTVPWFQLFDWRYWTLIIPMYAISMVLIVQESLTIYIKRQQLRHHFADRETWMRLVFLVLAIFLPVVLACAEPADWQRHVACAALLLGWLQAMFLLSRFPSWGSYVLMFGTVAINLLKILASMLFLIIGFSFCFMIQYRSTPPFDGPAAAFFKTLVMMASEFDYENLIDNKHDKELRDTMVVVRLLFGFFVIFVVVALMNFMTGAAVSDINELNLMAKVRRLEKQVQLLGTIEAIVYDGAYANILKKVFRQGRYYKKITYSRTKVTKWKVISANVLEKSNKLNNDCEGQYKHLSNYTGTGFTISPLTCDSDDVNILEQSFDVRPSIKLNEAFIKISRKKEWCEEKTNVYITKNMIEELHDAFLDKPEGEETGKKDWVRRVISKQDERMTSLAEDLQQVSQANEQMKCFIENMNSKIEKLISNQTQTSDSIKELTVEIKKMA